MNNGKIGTTAKQKNGMAALSKAYLVSYNGLQTVGWSYVLFKAVKFLATKQTINGLWVECNPSLTIFQSLACLEVIHCATGLVPSSAVTTLCQVLSRLFMVWGILSPIQKAQTSSALPFMIVAWSITEVVRYSYYVSHLCNVPIKPLTWARYSLFLGLYPIGVSGELGTTWTALDTIRRTQLFSVALPNKANFSFNYHYICMIVMLSYIPMFPQLFGHMLKQRKKILGRPAVNGTEKKVK